MTSTNTPTTAERRQAWIQACRLRTLPLTASGSFIAAAIAASHHEFRWPVFLLMLVTSVALQVIANFADDYGDLASGLDDETRVGPKRGLQRGVISVASMRRAIIGLCVATFAVGVCLILVAFSSGPTMDAGSVIAIVVFLVLGIASIAAAILYTIGKHPYGYIGLGDIISFLFFGIVAVVAGTFLYTHSLVPESIVGGIALGLPVMAVMNVNNMRDARRDKAKGKRTIANLLGDPGMRVYETALLGIGAALFIVCACMTGTPGVIGIVALVASFIPWGLVLAKMWRTPDPESFDRLMGPTSMGTVLVALVFTAVVVLGL